MHDLEPVLIGQGDEFMNNGRNLFIVPAARRRHLAIFGGAADVVLQNVINELAVGI